MMWQEATSNESADHNPDDQVRKWIGADTSTASFANCDAEGDEDRGCDRQAVPGNSDGSQVDEYGVDIDCHHADSPGGNVSLGRNAFGVCVERFAGGGWFSRAVPVATHHEDHHERA